MLHSKSIIVFRIIKSFFMYLVFFVYALSFSLSFLIVRFNDTILRKSIDKKQHVALVQHVFACILFAILCLLFLSVFFQVSLCLRKVYYVGASELEMLVLEGNVSNLI